MIRSMGGLEEVLKAGKKGEREFYDDRVLGGGDFVESILKHEDKTEEMGKAEILGKIFRETGVQGKEIFSCSRERRIVAARAEYCYLRREKGGVKGTELMRELGINSSAVSYLVLIRKAEW